jgi:hypothetical protein
MATREEIDRFEELLKQLKTKYDLFFNGARKLPPLEDRRRLDAMVQELAKSKMRDNGLRFRYNTLVGRLNQYRELWGRKMREREEGPLDFRRRQQAMQAAPPDPEPPPPPPPYRPRETSAEDRSYVRVGDDGNSTAINELLVRINEANRQLGKSGNVSLEQVSRMISTQAETIRSKYSVRTIAFRVDTSEGKVKLKAKPIQE